MARMGDVYTFLGKDRFVEFARNHARGQRLGQAFMNALDVVPYRALTGTPHDPFQSNRIQDVWAAIDHLREQS